MNRRARSAAVLPQAFYARRAIIVAKELLGKVLICEQQGSLQAAAITETEAYVGAHDLACHASKGRTDRTAVMFGPAGNWYVYLVYGMHWMLNIVTDEVETPSAVLIRGGGVWDGPAKLTRAMQIDRRFNGEVAQPKSGLWIEDRGAIITRREYSITPRIGVDYAGEWAAKPYRFVLTAATIERLL